MCSVNWPKNNARLLKSVQALATAIEDCEPQARAASGSIHAVDKHKPVKHQPNVTALRQMNERTAVNRHEPRVIVATMHCHAVQPCKRGVAIRQRDLSIQ